MKIFLKFSLVIVIFFIQYFAALWVWEDWNLIDDMLGMYGIFDK